MGVWSDEFLASLDAGEREQTGENAQMSERERAQGSERAQANAGADAGGHANAGDQASERTQANTPTTHAPSPHDVSRTKKPRQRRQGVLASTLVLALIGAGIVGTLAATHYHGTTTPARMAVIHDGEGNTYTMPLDVNDTKTVTTSLGTNVVTVANGEVFIAEADCDNLDCVEQGPISSADRQIVCLPHKLWVEIAAEDTGGGNADDNAGDGNVDDGNPPHEENSPAKEFDTIGS